MTDQPDEELRDKEIKECKKRGYRKMSLDVLKNRNAERDTSVKLRYYPAYNYFTEETDNTPRKPIVRK